jgi:hypothetical protein
VRDGEVAEVHNIEHVAGVSSNGRYRWQQHHYNNLDVPSETVWIKNLHRLNLITEDNKEDDDDDDDCNWSDARKDACERFWFA